jgi:hypothetical protein
LKSIETVANVEVSRAVGADSNEREVVKAQLKVLRLLLVVLLVT